MPFVEHKKLPDKELTKVGLQRDRRKSTRTNRATAIKGVLVNPGENVQRAIDAVNKNGGGIVTLISGTHNVDYDITIPSFVTLQGEGKDGTIIDFNSNNNQVLVSGTADNSSSTKTRNFRIKDLTIQESGNTTSALDISYGRHFILDNIRVSNNSGSGARIRASQQYSVFNSLADNNSLDGFELVGASEYAHGRFTFVGCISTNNTDDGFALTTAVGELVANGAFVACESDNNGDDGFVFYGSLEVATYLTNCIANNNSDSGFKLNASYISLSACTAQDNDEYGVYNTGINNPLTACTITGNNEDLDSTQRMSFVGNTIAFGSTTDPKASLFGTTDVAIQAWGTTGGNTRTEKRVMQMYNGSGSTISQGMVVTLNASAALDQVTTTTAQGDDKVFGMVMFDIANGAWGAILVEGYTTKLKVDGTTNISIGDLLGTFTTAGIAMKAAAGDMAFAYAGEAYTTDDSNGVIDALLITPRKV